MQQSYLAVDLFFMLSGVVIAQAYGSRLLEQQLSFRAFARIRLIRIMPLYLLGSALSVCIMLTGPLDAGSAFNLLFYVTLGAFMIPNPGFGTIDVYPLNNPAWSLPLELGANALYVAFIDRLTLLRMIGILLFNAAGIALTLWLITSHSLNFGFWAKSFPFGMFRVGYSFFSGVLLFRYYQQLSEVAKRIRCHTLCAWLVIAAVVMILTAAPSRTVQPFYDFVAVTCVFPLIIGFGLMFQPSGTSARVFRFFGTMSYAVYMLHAPFGGLIDTLSAGRMEQNAPWSGLAFLVAVSVVSVAADAWYDFPVRRWLLRNSAGHKQAQPVSRALPS